MKTVKLNLIVLALSAALAAPLFAETLTEPQLLDLLAKPDASPKEKSDACHELAHLGTKEAVPALAALLGDAQLSHLARYALEPIPDASVDDAFRAALGKVKGRQLTGVINSIGTRRDEKAVELLAPLLGDSNPEIAAAASATLGKIASRSAVALLEKSLAVNPEIASQGLLRAAESARVKGKDAVAAELFAKLRDAQVSDGVRLAAIRGAILASSSASAMADQIKSGDPVGLSAALRAAQEVAGTKWTRALLDALPDLPVERQIPVLQTLGIRRDAIAVPVLAAAMKESGDAAVRLAAVQSLVMIGSAEAVAPLLAAMTSSTDAMVRAVAKSGLANFSAKGTDAAITALLQSADDATKHAAVELLGQRRVTAALPELDKVLFDGSDATRIAAAEAVGKFGGEMEVASLLHALTCAGSDDETKTLESALASVISRNANSAAISTDVLSAFEQAKGAKKAAVIRLLPGIGNAAALTAVRSTMADADAAIKDAGLRALCGWPNADSLPDLTQLAKSSGDETMKVLALRGAIRLAAKQPATLGELIAIATRAEEKRLVLGSLADLDDPAALALAMQQIGDAKLKGEAALAAVSIAERIPVAQSASAMEQLLAAQPHEGVAARARAVLEKAKKP